jgi:Ca2+-transporting ATPase
LLFALLKNYNQAIILLIATIPLIGMDAFLHWRTQVSTHSLKSSLAAQATVIRNGIEMQVAARELVPGDLVVVATGMSFPADGLIVAGKNLQVDESALTGESRPVKKEVLSEFQRGSTQPSVEGKYWGFAGTRILAGRALLRVVYTGSETLYGEIVTSAIHTTQERTPLQKAIARLVMILIFTASGLCFILAIVRYLQGFGLIDAILSAATLAVAALPDEFPVVFTFFLGVGVYRLAKKHALVQRAVSVENIGRISYICSDKTGTITEGRFQLVKLLAADNLNTEELLFIATAASRLESGDLIDIAIFNKPETALEIPQPLKTFPFTENRKRETSIIEIESQQYLVATKGAPEKILDICSLDAADKEKWLQKIEELAFGGYKVIACAHLLTQQLPDAEPEFNYEFAGLLALTDPPRSGVANAINTCRANNIHVLMITGDHPETARAIAREVGLGNGNPHVVVAEDLAQQAMSADSEYFRKIDVIARAIPTQKLEIVNRLQSYGEIVAVTGDGVNDVPALKAADIGIAMGERGAQSAREAADIILLDDNFDSIVNAIAEGKQLFKNMQSSFKYLLLIHLPFVLSAAIIPLFGYPLLYLPIHIVFIELIIHPTSMLVFQDLPASNQIEPVRNLNDTRFFSNKDWKMITAAGLFTTGIVIATFFFVYQHNHDMDHARALVLAELGFISAALTLGLSGFRTRVARMIICMTLAFTVLLIEIPVISQLFAFTPLGLFEWLTVIAVSLITLILVKKV